ncbi:MAG TPA: PAS domain S-box protein, partial [Flavisolibacter sp.]|nr:PAS domain S-box protein [Flavisolibacter sp.]
MRNSAQLRKFHMDKKALQSLLNSSLDVICSIDVEGKFVHVSAAAIKLWGYQPAELAGRKYIDMVMAEDQCITKVAANAIMRGLDVTSFENRYIRKDGSVVPVLWSARWSEEEQLMYCVAKDATEIKKAKEQNKLLDKRLGRAYKLARLAWWELDVASGVYTCSDEIFMMYGLPVPANNQITVAGFLACVHPDDRPKLQHDLSCLSQDAYVNYEHRIVKPAGDVIYVCHYSEVLSDSKGNPVSLHGTTREITKERLQQRHLEESEKKLQENAHQLSEILES